jgi:hypothetical protein
MKNEVLENGPRSQLGAKANPNIVGSNKIQSQHGWFTCSKQSLFVGFFKRYNESENLILNDKPSIKSYRFYV